jgi:hypothetical protein
MSNGLLQLPSKHRPSIRLISFYFNWSAEKTSTSAQHS